MKYPHAIGASRNSTGPWMPTCMCGWQGNDDISFDGAMKQASKHAFDAPVDEYLATHGDAMVQPLETVRDVFGCSEDPCRWHGPSPEQKRAEAKRKWQADHKVMTDIHDRAAKRLDRVTVDFRQATERKVRAQNTVMAHRATRPQ